MTFAVFRMNLRSLARQAASGAASVFFQPGELMEEIAGRKCTPVEHQLVEQWAKENSFRLACCLDDESYKRFPSEPQLAIEQDPGELDKMDDEVEDWKNTMKRWKRENKTKKALCD